jgi:hypothetical protein
MPNNNYDIFRSETSSLLGSYEKTPPGRCPVMWGFIHSYARSTGANEADYRRQRVDNLLMSYLVKMAPEHTDPISDEFSLARARLALAIAASLPALILQGPRTLPGIVRPTCDETTRRMMRKIGRELELSSVDVTDVRLEGSPAAPMILADLRRTHSQLSIALEMGEKLLRRDFYAVGRDLGVLVCERHVDATVLREILELLFRETKNE